MGDLTGTVTTENGSGRKKRGHRWVFADFVRKGVLAAFALSMLILAVYTAGSIPDPGFSDRLLILLLRLQRYAWWLLCAFSLCAMGFSVRRLVYHPCVRSALGLSFYFFTGIMGAGFAMFNSMIIAAAGGNG